MPWDRRTFRVIKGGRAARARPLRFPRRRQRPRRPRLPRGLGLPAPIAVIVVIALLERFGGWRGPTLGLGPEGVAAACARGTLTGAVTHVRDGDTIAVAGVPIRLSGLAAPERDEPGGSAATAAMRRMVAGRQLRCELDGTRTYDRCAGVCYLNGRDVSAEMVRMGLARDCPRFSGGRYREAERQAAATGARIREVYELPGYCLRR